MIKDDILTQVAKIKGTDNVTVKKTYIPPLSKITITTDNNAITEVEVKNKGFCFAPEVSILKGYDDGYLGLGIKFAYWSRLSASAGFGFCDFRSICFKPYIAINYNIPYFKNTNVGVSYNGNVGIKLSVSF